MNHDELSPDQFQGFMSMALENYKSQKNVIRKSGNSRLNYGKIVGLQDMDPD